MVTINENGININKGIISIGSFTGINTGSQPGKRGVYINSSGGGLIGYVTDPSDATPTPSNYIRWTGSTLSINTSNFTLKGGLQSDAVPSGTDKGIYLNSGGHFVVGNASNYLRWNGSTLTLQGNYNQTGGYISLGTLIAAGAVPGSSSQKGFRVSSIG